MVIPQIIVIHDDWKENEPILAELRETYGSQNVKFITESQAGIDYILNAPSTRTIVLLDYNFKTGEPTGGEVFKKIRSKSSLIYVIIVTKSQNKSINPDDFFEFVNNNALAIARPNDIYTDLINLVETARHQLEMRADVIIEEWITSRPEEEREVPYLAFSDGNTYTLNELLFNIRSQTSLGKEIEADILSLAINLIMKKSSNEA